jgi:hypothetical protein
MINRYHKNELKEIEILGNKYEEQNLLNILVQ